MSDIVNKELIPEGIINIDTQAGKYLCFTSDGFDPHSYLWRKGNTVVVSFIISKQKGRFQKMMARIVEMGFDFEIPAPTKRMAEIGRKQGWIFCKKDCEVFGRIDIITNKAFL